MLLVTIEDKEPIVQRSVREPFPVQARDCRSWQWRRLEPLVEMFVLVASQFVYPFFLLLGGLPPLL